MDSITLGIWVKNSEWG
jgi:hypothetical protein